MALRPQDMIDSECIHPNCGCGDGPCKAVQESAPVILPAAAFPFAFGSKTLPGLAKLAEEAGEVQQVIGKLMMTGGAAAHWDGSDLIQRLKEEMADLMAAMVFVGQTNFAEDDFAERTHDKLALFMQWHREQAQ